MREIYHPGATENSSVAPKNNIFRNFSRKIVLEINNIYFKLNLKNLILLMFIANIAIIALGYHFSIIINISAAIISTGNFGILTIISTFSKKSNLRDRNSIEPKTKLTYLFLIISAPITAAILEYYQIYHFNLITIVLAILIPTLAMTPIIISKILKVNIMNSATSLLDAIPKAEQKINFKHKFNVFIKSNFATETKDDEHESDRLKK